MSQTEKLLSQIFTIPLEKNKYLVYAPIKKIAFTANAQLINGLAERCERGLPNHNDTSDAMILLEKLDFFTPAPLPKDDWSETGVRYDAVILFLTNQCNLHCTYCYASAGEYPKKEMSWEIAKAAIDRVMTEVLKHRLPVMTLGFHGGGEPTANWPLLTRSVEYTRQLADKNGVSLHLSGAFNGYWLDKVRDYMLSHFTDVSLSFDGLPETQNLQRPSAGYGESFPRLEKTLRALDESPVNYGIRMTVTHFSVDTLVENTAYICEHFKPQKIQIEPVFMAGRARINGLEVTDLDAFIDNFIQAFKLAQAHGVEVFYSGARPETLTQRFCLAACRALVVTPDGHVTTCFETFGPEHPLTEQFFVGAYESGQFSLDKTKLEKHFSHTVETLPHCRECFCKWHCAGDCAAKTYSDDSENSHLPPRCYVNQELTKYFVLDKVAQSGGFFHQID